MLFSTIAAGCKWTYPFNQSLSALQSPYAPIPKFWKDSDYDQPIWTEESVDFMDGVDEMGEDTYCGASMSMMFKSL